MQKFNLKSKKGFTLIELLVVIGILAVLAAIAIPSVAGLIDRANVSADDTNANEMTNAIERFTSEYELVCQDIASGRFDLNDLDSAQSRVYNSTGIKDRDTIKSLENGDLSGKGINKDTKYPINALTTKSIIENYTKTSSATYEPKQSDMHFYYSPDCGVVVVDEATVGEPNVTELNKLIISGKDAKGKELSSSTVWINLSTSDVSMETPVEPDLNLSHGNIIPEGATYQIDGGELLVAGQPFPATTTVGDEYTYGDYMYKVGYHYIRSTNSYWKENTDITGWCPVATDATKTTYASPLESINNVPITSLMRTYAKCTNLTYLPDDYKIPSKCTSTRLAFTNCENLVTLPDGFRIPNSVTETRQMFQYCSKLTGLPEGFAIPNGVTEAGRMFADCTSLVNIPSTLKLSEHTTRVSQFFSDCASLKTLPETFTIPSSLYQADGFFSGCTSLESLPSTFKLLNAREGYQSLDNFFLNCSSLKSLPDGFTISHAVSMRTMFSGCTSLGEVNITIPSSVYYTEGLFTNCTNLTGTIRLEVDERYIAGDEFDGTVKPITIEYPSTWTVPADQVYQYDSFGQNLTFVTY